MTEKNLFRTTLITLGSTLVLPLIVGATGLAAPDGKPAGELVKNYVGATTADQKRDETEQTRNDAKTSTDKSADSSQPAKTDDTTNQASQPAASPSPAPQAATSAGDKAAGTYTVKAGDTYGCIAEKYYGSYDQWPRVYNANAGWPGFEEYHLAVGAVLQMPAVSSANALPKTSICQP